MRVFVSKKMVVVYPIFFGLITLLAGLSGLIIGEIYSNLFVSVVCVSTFISLMILINMKVVKHWVIATTILLILLQLLNIFLFFRMFQLNILLLLIEYSQIIIFISIIQVVKITKN